MYGLLLECKQLFFFFVERRSLATLRKAEFGFLGVRVKTFKQTPFFCGDLSKSGDRFKTFFGPRMLLHS